MRRGVSELMFAARTFFALMRELRRGDVVLTVTDTHLNLTRQYTRPAGSAFAPLADTAHFPCRISAGASR